MRRHRIFLSQLVLWALGAAGMAQAESSSMGSSLPAPRQGEVALSQPPVPLSAWHPPVFRQVRIEQHFSIRITPGTAAMPPALVEELEESERVDRAEQRRGGKCLGIGSIAAVQPGDGDELLLFLHDQRIISVKLEKRCNARAFYSGFYIARNADGAICPGRDILQSRSGTNCKVRRLNELVRSGYRRFP